jgi:cbb3-type cytochrome oxidase cytochrome c subunit
VEDLKDSRRVGPELTHVASKLRPEFVQQWVYFPQKFRPSTRMPHFFMQENNRQQSANSFDPDPVTRTETEVAAVSKYLYAVSRPFQPIPKPEGVTGDAERGRKLFSKAGCLACHANVAEFGEAWITADTRHRAPELSEEQASYKYKSMTDEERVRYAMDHFVDERDTFLNPSVARFDPEAAYNSPTMTRFAPELSGIGSKVTFDWLYSWLIEPTHYAPNTKMPSLRLSPGEAADIATYLLTLKQEGFKQFAFDVEGARRRMAEDLMFDLLTAQRSERQSRAIMDDSGGMLTDMLVSLLQASLGKQEAYDLVQPMTLEEKRLLYLGNKTVSHYGCYACHDIPGFETATPPGTDLSGWAEKPVSQLDFAFYDHAFHDMRHEKERIFGYVYPRDAEPLNHLSPTPDDLREEITHTHAAFAKHKMLNPRIWDREKLKRPYDKLKMPNFYFTEEEAEALTSYLLSRIPPRVHDNLKVDYDGGTLGPIAKGRSLTRELNCVGCHAIEDNVPTIQQYFRREIGGRPEFDVANAPPSLRGEGAKLQHNWFHRFLLQVEPLRPWLEVRMPSFNLTSDEATTLVQYFAALSRDDSDRLARALPPVDETLSKATENDSGAAEWWTTDHLRPEAEELERFAVERELMRERDLDPALTSAERVRAAHAQMLDRVRFIERLYDVDYPFVEPPSPLSPKDRFDRGMRFLNDMGCLKCHVLGEMRPGQANNVDEFVQTYRLDGVRGEGDQAIVILNGQTHPVGSIVDGHTIISGSNTYNETGDVDTKAVVEGPGPDGTTEQVLLVAASAPNLSLTYERLRRDWVVQWMVAPQWIQPGTKMPQNFAGGVSPFEGDPEYPGTGIDHINLLVDAIFDAGRTSTRVALPKIPVVDTAEEFDEEGGAFEEEEFDD